MRENPIRYPLVVIAALALAACSSSDQPVPGEVPVFDGISEDEALTLLGTEPFWGAKINGSTLTYSTPDNIEGVEIEVSRFAGNGGLGLNGEFNGEAMQIAVTPGECSDGMSERTYPFTVTLIIGETQLNGCGYSDEQPFSGEETP